MRWTYDLDQRALYIELSSARPSEQVEMSDGTIVDLDESGAVVGIEVLAAWAGWDWRAVVDAFGLDERLARSIAHVAQSPLLGVRSTRRGRAGGPVIAPAETTSGVKGLATAS